MTDNKRLAKNTLFLYFRMLLLMIISLYTSRITLQVLGVTDFGIYNIVAGVVVLFAFLSRLLNSASSRFLSLAVSTNDECEIQRNFSTILVGHIYLMLIVLFLLESIGFWFVIGVELKSSKFISIFPELFKSISPDGKITSSKSNISPEFNSFSELIVSPEFIIKLFDELCFIESSSIFF